MHFRTLSFRFKLFLAMTISVAVVSVITLLVVQRRVQNDYERMFRRQFDRQFSYFAALQDARLAGVERDCLKFCQSTRVVAALEGPDINPEIVYDTGDDELRRLLGTILEEVKRTGLTGQRRAAATTFLFLDAEGKAIPLTTNFHKQFGFRTPLQRVEQKLKQIRGALASSERQQVGYLAITLATNRPNLRPVAAKKGPAARFLADEFDQTNALPLQEVILTKVIDAQKDRVLGAMVVCFPLEDFIPQPKSGLGTNVVGDVLQAGILLDDKFHANTNVIPEALGESIVTAVGKKIQITGRARDDFTTALQDRPYQVFYEILNQGSAFPKAYQVCLYSLEEALREKADLRWKIIGSGGAALAGALLLGMFLSHGLTVPLKELVKGTTEIERGNLGIRVPVRSSDEVGQLATSFNDMAEGLAQKERYRTVLNQVADEQVARKLISGEITLGGELREASVLFCDIRGFTALTANMPPAEVIELLNEHMAEMMQVVRRHNGVLDKFVGDLLMVIFGAPVAYGNDVFDAARCALRLVEQREKLNGTSRFKLHVGIGLATGQVVAGGMGSSERFHYTVLGERVNLASRLCDYAPASTVLVDQTTAQRLGDAAHLQPLPSLELKGFQGAVMAYQLVSLNYPDSPA